nr:hypothetical protein CFP56_78158 [Quercus suber]
MNLYYLDQRFQSGSIIKVLEIPFHSGFKRTTDMTCNHAWFLKLYESPIDSKDLTNQFERNRVEVEFGAPVSHILRCGVHAECICPLVQHLSTDTLPPNPIPAFPICSISNTVMPSLHLLNSCLELSNSNSMETTYTDSDSPSEVSHDDGCDSSLSLCTSPMGRNYPPPQPQVTVPDDTSHISLPKLHLAFDAKGHHFIIVGLIVVAAGEITSSL